LDPVQCRIDVQNQRTQQAHEPLRQREQHDRPALEDPLKSVIREVADIAVRLGRDGDIGIGVTEGRQVSGDAAWLDSEKRLVMERR
jgi:hypothetical protein